MAGETDLIEIRYQVAYFLAKCQFYALKHTVAAVHIRACRLIPVPW